MPVRHFGLILPPADWRALADRLTAAGADFIIAPQTRFAGGPGEPIPPSSSATPPDNALEFKAFADEAMIFAR